MIRRPVWQRQFGINNRRPAQGGQYKDAEFSRSAVMERWAAGLEDVRYSTANLEWVQPTALMAGVRVYHLPPEAPSMGSAESGPPAVRVYDGQEPAGSELPHDTRPLQTA
jgi:hypothetical protein